MFDLLKLIEKKQSLQVALAGVPVTDENQPMYMSGCGEACTGTCSNTCDGGCEGYCTGSGCSFTK